ncbi:hypothetical protein niasHT_039155 [Heterodera trifolii]|uniref:DNA2/NAM7 helicase-like C-terminal domain-containing protein n=1 Tax=Heterodera trifolii TaxID=157864 RepID=A0ABD2IJ42_9BILA
MFILDKEQILLSENLCQDEKYVDDFNKAPRRARERTTTAALLNMTKYRVYFMTLVLAEELALDLGNINYVLVDECGQATLSAILSTLTQFRMSNASDLWSHSAIVKCLDAGVYAPAGDRLVPEKSDAEISFFLNFMGPRIVTENCPVVLIHLKTPAQQESVSFSSHNPEQRETALEFLGIIQRTFSGLIQIVCFYQAERKQVTLEIERRKNVKAGTVDSIQSQEADLVIVLTTRTGAGRTEDVNIGIEFWADAARTTVAVSRPRFGLIVIGDLTLLWHKGEVWRRFLDQALKMTVAVTPDYIGLISNHWPNLAILSQLLHSPICLVRALFLCTILAAHSFGMMVIDTSVFHRQQCMVGLDEQDQMYEWRLIHYNESHVPNVRDLFLFSTFLTHSFFIIFTSGLYQKGDLQKKKKKLIL